MSDHARVGRFNRSTLLYLVSLLVGWWDADQYKESMVKAKMDIQVVVGVEWFFWLDGRLLRVGVRGAGFRIIVSSLSESTTARDRRRKKSEGCTQLLQRDLQLYVLREIIKYIYSVSVRPLVGRSIQHAKVWRSTQRTYGDKWLCGKGCLLPQTFWNGKPMSL